MRIILTLFSLVLFSNSLFAQPTEFLKSKTEGLLIGTLFGDALGGPIEFQGHPEIQATPNPPKLWKAGEFINDAELKAATNRIYLREYKHLRPVPEPYAHWSVNAMPGTVTDDSRHKIILLNFFKSSISINKWPQTETDLARSYLQWSKSNTIKTHSGYDTLVNQWLGESYKSIQWILGNRKIGEAYPPERLWNALPTCYGQMALPPVAAIYPGQAEKAYKAAYSLAWFENGFAKDMIAAIVAGLAKGLSLDPKQHTDEQLWIDVINTMKNTDPYQYNQVPWSERAVNRWFRLVDELVDASQGSPQKLFELMDVEFKNTVKWEAQVPFVVIFSCVKICKYNPLAALQLSIEWGWDHDSYAQLLGAFVGAIYGPEIFKPEWKLAVENQLMKDYNESVADWISTLTSLREVGKKRELFIPKK